MTSDARAIPMPDPIRAHGAWIYLFVSVGAGALVGAQRGVEPAMLVGTGFAGAYLVAAAVAMGLGRKLRQALIGCVLAVIAPPLALALGADRAFLLLAGATLVPAVGAVALARAYGFLSHVAVSTGICAIVLAAPTVAIAGGASPGRATLLFALLWPFFCWRSLRIARRLVGIGTWDRDELRASGLREAAVAAVWTLVVAIVL